MTSIGNVFRKVLLVAEYVSPRTSLCNTIVIPLSGSGRSRKMATSSIARLVAVTEVEAEHAVIDLLGLSCRDYRT